MSHKTTTVEWAGAVVRGGAGHPGPLPAWRAWLADDAHRRWDQLRMSRGLDLTCAGANRECARIGGGACFFTFIALGELGSTMSADEWPVVAVPLLGARMGGRPPSQRPPGLP